MKCNFYIHPRHYNAEIAELENGEFIALFGWNGEIWSECWHVESAAGYPTDPAEPGFSCRPVTAYELDPTLDPDDELSLEYVGIEIL